MQVCLGSMAVAGRNEFSFFVWFYIVFPSYGCLPSPYLQCVFNKTKLESGWDWVLVCWLHISLEKGDRTALAYLSCSVGSRVGGVERLYLGHK